jgi:cyclophilin family peptidyl-prolyl cis-trans isomerase
VNHLIVSLLVVAALPAATASAQAPQVTLETNHGAIVIELYPDKAPASVANFLEYVRAGFYDGTVFHRVIDGFMIQGGGFTADLAKKDTRAPIKNESENGLGNERGTIAMARTNDPHSATSQFFVNLKDNTFLNHTGKNVQGWGYTVFGQVVEGMDVVDAIAAVRTGNKGPHQNVPIEPVVITKATVVPTAAAK